LAFARTVGSPGAKVRPALVAQSDPNNARLHETISAAITGTVSRVQEAARLLLSAAPP
jgi:mRNA-degrading endonuclease toxin of MazEF toxin-antitoxin module